MSKNLIDVPKNPIVSNRKWKIATQGKLKLYPCYRHRFNSFFAPDSIAEALFYEHLEDELDDMYFDRED
jgi:hypothetical protein